MANAYNDKLNNPLIIYEGSDKDMIRHLQNLWNADRIRYGRNVEYKSLPENFNLLNFKDTLKNISDNLVFRGNFGGYDNQLEKEMSLTKKSVILDPKNCKLLYLCLNDLFRYNSIRSELFNKIKFADIFLKHKKGDNKDPKNFRFLSNHTKIFKIIDKYWTNSLIGSLQKNNCLPDSSIVRNNFSREFTMSIRDLALEKLEKYNMGKKIVLLDIQKAFDSVSWPVLNKLVTKNIARKMNKEYAEKIMAQYMFLNTNRCILFKNKSIECNRSIATGLPSSTIVFSLLIEEIIYEWKNKVDSEDIIINTFVDDMYLEFENISNSKFLVESLIEYLESYGLIINQSKTKTNIEILPYSKIDKTDCYLGLPFANDREDYIDECVKMFQGRYYNITREEIVDILKKNENTKVRKEILGFFNYKFYGLKLLGEKEVDVLGILEKNHVTDVFKKVLVCYIVMVILFFL